MCSNLAAIGYIHLPACWVGMVEIFFSRASGLGQLQKSECGWENWGLPRIFTALRFLNTSFKAHLSSRSTNFFPHSLHQAGFFVLKIFYVWSFRLSAKFVHHIIPSFDIPSLVQSFMFNCVEQPQSVSQLRRNDVLWNGDFFSFFGFISPWQDSGTSQPRILLHLNFFVKKFYTFDCFLRVSNRGKDGTDERKAWIETTFDTVRLTIRPKKRAQLIEEIAKSQAAIIIWPYSCVVRCQFVVCNQSTREFFVLTSKTAETKLSKSSASGYQMLFIVLHTQYMHNTCRIPLYRRFFSTKK